MRYVFSIILCLEIADGKYDTRDTKKSRALCPQILSANSQISLENFDRICTTIVLKHVLFIVNFPWGNCRRQMRYDRYEESCAIYHQILSANLQIPSENSQISTANFDR